MALTKADLVVAVQENSGLNKSQSADIVESTLSTIKNKLISGEDVLVSGFGKFQLQDKRARKGRNPATGEDLMLRSRRIVTFKCPGKPERITTLSTVEHSLLKQLSPQRELINVQI